MTYLPTGCERPNLAELDAFWTNAKIASPTLPDEYQVRWIGIDRETTLQVIELIRSGDKTGTFTLPWVVEHTEQTTPLVGDTIILIDFDGHPHLIVRLTHIETVAFGDITETHTAIDGPPVRDLSIWKPLHTDYWNGMLAPFGKRVSDAMPVWVEKFELLTSRTAT